MRLTATYLIASFARGLLGIAANSALAGPPTSAAIPSAVVAAPRGYGVIFTDARGMALYTSELDAKKPGASTCYGECTKRWPPLIADKDAIAVGNWSIIKRDDGSAQWAHRGLPVHTYALDPAPNVTFGDGFGQTWHVARDVLPLPPDVGITRTLLGETLSDSRGRTLYVRSARSSCVRACMKEWTPFLAPALGNPIGEWAVLNRPDGNAQWTFRGEPVFQYDGDIQAAETNGDGHGWRAVVLESAPPRPEWVTIQGSDAGVLYADADGLTLYTHTLLPGVCNQDDNCVVAEWRPVLARRPSNLKAIATARVNAKQVIGNWGTVVRRDGEIQWTYKGQPLFKNINDRKPGDFRGIRYGGDRTYAAIMLNGEIMPGVKGSSASLLQ